MVSWKIYVTGIIVASIVASLITSFLAEKRYEEKYKDYIPHNAIPFNKVQLNDLGFYDTLTYNDYDDVKREDVVRKYRLVEKNMCYSYDCDQILLKFQQIEVDERK